MACLCKMSYAAHVSDISQKDNFNSSFCKKSVKTCCALCFFLGLIFVDCYKRVFDL